MAQWGQTILSICVATFALAVGCTGQAEELDSHGSLPALLGDFNCNSVAFYKTHKTASSTVALVLDRVGGVRNYRFIHNGQRAVFSLGRSKKSKSQPQVDFSTTHVNFPFIATIGYWNTVMNDPSLLTIVRDPVKHFISHFFYFSKEEKNADNLKNYTSRHAFQANEMIARTNSPSLMARRLRDFVQSKLFNSTFFLIAEHLAEGLAALQLHCGWSYRDMAFGHVHCAACWDSKLASRSKQADPSSLEMAAGTYKAIHKKTWADAIVYKAALKKWEDIQRRGGELLQSTGRELSRRNAVLDEHCRSIVQGAEQFREHPGCLWMVLHPKEFYALLGPDNRVRMNATFTPTNEHEGYPNGLIQAWEMMQGFNKMYEGLFPVQGPVQTTARLFEGISMLRGEKLGTVTANKTYIA